MVLSELVWAGVKAFIIALVLTPIVRDVFRAYNVVDRPGRRTVHAYPTPRVGGVSITVAYVVALLTLFDPKTAPEYYSDALQLLPGVLIIFATGLMDDFLNLKPSFKLLGQVAGAAAVFASGLRIETLAGQALPFWLSVAVTIFWLLLCTNALNLIDGLDGLCAGIGFIGAMTLFTAGIVRGEAGLTFTMLPLAGSLLGFLVFNFNPATVFLGDSGALTIGFALGCGGVMWENQTDGRATVVLPLLALSIPLMDLSLSIVRRSLKGQAIFSADRGHTHHRLLDRGLTARRAALALYLMALPGAAAAILLSYNTTGTIHILAIPAWCFVTAMGIFQLRYAEFEVTGRLLFKGGFRRARAGKELVAQLRNRLQLAGSEDQWWKILVTAGEESAGISVSRIGGDSLRQPVSSSTPPLWSLRIPVTGSETVLIEASSGFVRDGLYLPALPGVLIGTFPANRLAVEQPAFS